MTMSVGEGAGGAGSGPDWTVIGGAIVAALTALGGIVAGIRGASKSKVTEDDQRRQTRDTAATADAALTLKRVAWLVEQLQEENIKKSAEIASLLVRIGELEAEIRTLKSTQYTLEQQIRDLRDQLNQKGV